MEEQRTPEQWRERLAARPLPGEGTPPHELHGVSEAGYESAGESLARALLVLVDERPSLLLVPSPEEDPNGFEAGDNRKLWDAFKERWPDGNEWLGGITGFQFGWAHNTVRYVVGAEQVGNPAIVEVAVEEERS